MSGEPPTCRFGHSKSRISNTAPRAEIEERHRRRRQRGKLPFEIDQAGGITHRLAGDTVILRQAVRHDDGEEAVIIADRQFGILEIDLAHMGEKLQILLGREDLCHRRLRHGEKDAARHIVRAVDLTPARHALFDRRLGRNLALAFSDDDERQPGNGSVGGIGARSQGSVRRLMTICGSRNS